MYKGVIFDLDGVIVSTDELHYQAWKHMAKNEGLIFDREMNNSLRGVSREESLEIIIKHNEKKYSSKDKKRLTDFKNDYYVESLSKLSKEDIMEDVMDTLNYIKDKNIKVAIGSSSKNARIILEKIGLADHFDYIVDGNDITESKPHPEVFALATKQLGLNSNQCLVIEDAFAGVDAALANNNDVLGVGDAFNYEKATYRSNTIAKIKELIK